MSLGLCMDGRLEGNTFSNESIFNIVPTDIMKAKMWEQVVPELQGLGYEEYRYFDYRPEELIEDLDKIFDKYGKDSFTLRWVLQIIYLSNMEDSIRGFYDSLRMKEHAALVDFLLYHEVKGFEKLIEVGFKKKNRD